MSFISLEDFKNITKDVNKDILIELLHTYIKRDIEDIETEEPKEENKEIKKITLVFENCETCDLEVDMFEILNIYGIKQDIVVHPIYSIDVLVGKKNSCDDLILEINEKGLKQNASSYDNDYQSLEDRLKTYKDITAVDITYEGNTKQEIYVLWNNESEFENKYQTIHQWSNNYITVRIGKENV